MERKSYVKRVIHRKKPVTKVPVSVRKYVKKAINANAEEKYALTNINGASITQDQKGVADAYYCLTDNIPQGLLDNNNRDGDQIRLHTFEGRYITQMDPAAATGNKNVTMRMIIFRANTNIDTTAAVGSGLIAIYPLSNILALGAGGVVSITSTYNHDRLKAKLFTILYDKCWFQTTAPLIGPGVNNNTRYIVIKKKLKNMKIEYIAGSTTNAMNHLFVLIMTNQNSGVANAPQLYSSTKVTYFDG